MSEKHSRSQLRSIEAEAASQIQEIERLLSPHSGRRQNRSAIEELRASAVKQIERLASATYRIEISVRPVGMRVPPGKYVVEERRENLIQEGILGAVLQEFENDSHGSERPHGKRA